MVAHHYIPLPITAKQPSGPIYTVDRPKYKPYQDNHCDNLEPLCIASNLQLCYQSHPDHTFLNILLIQKHSVVCPVSDNDNTWNKKNETTNNTFQY